MAKMQRKGNPPTLLVGMQLVQSLWKTVWRFLKKLKIELPYNPAIALLGIYPIDRCSEEKGLMYPNVHIKLSTISKLWKEPRCPSIDEWIKKMWSIYTMEYYSAIRKNDYPTLVTTWMELEEIVLSEISQAEKGNYHMVSLICGT